MGASWLHDPGPSNPISIMADTLRVPLLNTNFDDDIAYDLKGNKHRDGQATAAYEAFEKAVFLAAVKARKNPSKYGGISLEEAAKHQRGASKWTQPLMQLYAAGMDFELGAPLYKCSSTECIDGDWIAAEREGDSENEEHDPIFPVTGFGVIIDGLISGEATDNEKMRPRRDPRAEVAGLPPTTRRPIPCTFSAPVVSIVQTKIGDGVDLTGKCTVTAMKRHEGSEVPMRWDADAVICTLPVGVLKSGSVEFIPELSAAKRHAIAETGVGNVVKVILEFPTVFWDTHVTFMGIADAELCSDSSSSSMFEAPTVTNEGFQQRGLCTFFLNGHKTCKKNILVTYATGDAADMADNVRDSGCLKMQLLMRY